MFTNSRGRGNRLSQVGSRSHQTSQRYPQAGCGRGRDNPHQGKNSWPFSWGGATPTGFKGTGEKPVNQLGADSKPLLCWSCGSYRHFSNWVHCGNHTCEGNFSNNWDFYVTTSFGYCQAMEFSCKHLQGLLERPNKDKKICTWTSHTNEFVLHF